MTARETEVLMLIATGLTNRGIAARLFLSRRTVEKHVEHLLAKTDSSNRADLFRLVALDGPEPER